MNLLHNARIHTLDSARPTASALLIDRGQILAVGGDELFDHRAEKHDLGGRVVLPGLTDAHIHLQHYSLSLQKIDSFLGFCTHFIYPIFPYNLLIVKLI